MIGLEPNTSIEIASTETVIDMSEEKFGSTA